LLKFISDLKKLQDDRKRDETPNFDPEWLKNQEMKEEKVHWKNIIPSTQRISHLHLQSISEKCFRLINQRKFIK
jgi:hypothetical protein